MTNFILKAEIWLAAEEQGYSRTDPRSAFLIARRSPQGGWSIMPARTYMDAQQIAAPLKGVEVYVVSANDQHGLMKVGVDGNLVDHP